MRKGSVAIALLLSAIMAVAWGCMAAENSALDGKAEAEISAASAAPEPSEAEYKYIAAGEYAGEYWPTAGWRTCRPEAVGMDSGRLEKALEYAADPAFKAEGLLVVKDGYIVAEAYLNGFKKNDRHVSNSMAKSFTSSLIGMAIDKGLIPGIDEPLCRYYEDWNCDDESDLRSKIKIRRLDPDNRP